MYFCLFFKLPIEETGGREMILNYRLTIRSDFQKQPKINVFSKLPIEETGGRGDPPFPLWGVWKNYENSTKSENEWFLLRAF